jgi:hypothetical protein
MGWLISEQGLPRKRKYAADLMDDTGCARSTGPSLDRRRRPRSSRLAGYLITGRSPAR